MCSHWGATITTVALQTSPSSEAETLSPFKQCPSLAPGPLCSTFGLLNPAPLGGLTRVEPRRAGPSVADVVRQA